MLAACRRIAVAAASSMVRPNLFAASSVLSQPSFLVASSCLPSTAPATAGPARGYKTSTRRRRKEIRKQTAKYQRKLLDFARLFDPMRTAHEQVGQTLRYLGWEVNEREGVTETIAVDFALRQVYTAFEVVDGKHYVLPTAPNASDDVGMGSGVRPTVNAPGSKRLVTPRETPFPSAPPTWLSPVRGLVLDADTAARHATIRAKGWSLVVIPQPLWEFAAQRPHAAHYARRDLLLSLTLPLLPFPPRPVELQSGGASGGAGGGAGKGKVAQRVEEALATAAAAAAAAGKPVSASAAAARLAAATADAATGRSRKARRMGRMQVTAAAEAETATAASQ